MDTVRSLIFRPPRAVNEKLCVLPISRSAKAIALLLSLQRTNCVCSHPLFSSAKQKTPTWVSFVLVERDGFEPSKSVTTDLQSAPFGHSGISPNNGAGDGTRTRNLLITNQLLCQLSYTSIFNFSKICWVVTGTTHK